MRRKLLGEERGQMILWIALAVPLLILFAAMALDMGLIYWTKARLANATDAAVLTGVKTVAHWSSVEGNVPAGQADAQNYASKMFVGNFGSNEPTQAYTWCPGDASCPANTVSLTLHATTTVNTTFMSYLPRWAQWTVGATSQATRGNLVMSLVLDRSGSMCGGGEHCDPGVTGDQGGHALKGAVPAFIEDFAEGTDHVSLVTFASNSTVNVAVTQNFTQPVKDAVNGLAFTGGTFGTAAGTNVGTSTSHGPPLSMADNQNNTVVFPEGSSVVKAVVYFTDGLMNTVQDTFNCPAQTLLNYGGHDGGSQVDSFDPLSATNDFGCYNAAGAGCSSGLPYALGVCTNGGVPVRTFRSQKYGTAKPLTQANVTEEAKWRALYTADQIRRETPVGTYIYVIGLGHAIAADQCTAALLSSLANDPTGPAKYACASGPPQYDASQPTGLFLEVSDCPSATCTQSLSQAFQTIASRILLRLSK